MFEKEAEEYTKENLCKECHHHCIEGMCTCTECKKKTFKDGAELGYNKANEWHKQEVDDIYDLISEDWSVRYFICIMKDKKPSYCNREL